MQAPADTATHADPHVIDLVALHAHLQQHLDGYCGPLQAEKFKGGQSNPT